MKRVAWILVGGLLLAPPGLALKDTPPGASESARRSELSSEIGAFVHQAVNEGLLDAVEEDEEPGEPRSIVPEVVEPVVDVAAQVPDVAAPVDCSGPYPLDFSGLGNLTRYSDIYAFREETLPEGEVRASHAGATLARAYIALDLASEAAMTVRTGRDRDAVALQNLALVLEARGPLPIAFFTELSACHPQANLWRALILIAQNEEAGAALLDQNIAAFSQLPLQLRDRSALIAIPALDAMGQGDLVEALLETFSEEEIANSSQLQFAQAIVALGAGDPEAEQTIKRFLTHARFQDAALAALVRNNRPVSTAVREILLSDFVTKIELAQKDADVRSDLRFVLEELSADSMYQPMMRLAELPSMQSELARGELTRHLAVSLRRDLSSEDTLRNLAAIEAMVKDLGLLDGEPNRAELYETATLVAVRLGLGSLGQALAAKAKASESTAAQRAFLAHRQKNFVELFNLADLYPLNQQINLLAALAAVDVRDRVKLATFENRLSPEPETILALIEQDASTSHWLVSDRFYQAALKLEGDDQQWRVDRVIRLKNLPAQSPGPARMAISTIPGKLDRTRVSLAQLSAEAP